MTLFEPATLGTDLLLALLAGWLGSRVARRARPPSPAARWWGALLLLTAGAALVGGLHHGFAPNFPPVVVAAWWRLTLLLVALASACMAAALLAEMAPARANPWWWVIAGKFALTLAAILVAAEFRVVVLDYAAVLLAWAVAAELLRRPWRRAMRLGVGLSVAAAVVQQRHWGLGAAFNHNDVYHVIQAGALFAFYRAGRRFSGTSAGPSAGLPPS